MWKGCGKVMCRSHADIYREEKCTFKICCKKKTVLSNVMPYKCKSILCSYQFRKQNDIRDKFVQKIMLFKIVSAALLLISSFVWFSIKATAGGAEEMEMIIKNIKIKDPRSGEEKQFDNFLAVANCAPNWLTPKYSMESCKGLRCTEYRGK